MKDNYEGWTADAIRTPENQLLIDLEESRRAKIELTAIDAAKQIVSAEVAQIEVPDILPLELIGSYGRGPWS